MNLTSIRLSLVCPLMSRDLEINQTQSLVCPFMTLTSIRLKVQYVSFHYLNINQTQSLVYPFMTFTSIKVSMSFHE